KPYDRPRGYLLQSTQRAAPLPSPNGTGHHHDAPPHEGRQDHYADLFTDVANGKRLIKRHGKDLRFCKPWRKWLCWAGSHWRVDDTVTIESKAKETILALFTETTMAIAKLAAEVKNFE